MTFILSIVKWETFAFSKLNINKCYKITHIKPLMCYTNYRKTQTSITLMGGMG